MCVDIDKMKESKLGINNFDNSIDNGLEEELISNEGKVYGIHSGANFSGIVYYKDKKFHEDVYRFRDLVKTISSDNLRELMIDVCNEFGYE